MPQSLSNLEQQRSLLTTQLARLGDLRSGSVTGMVRRCGKPTCHCAQPDDHGHVGSGIIEAGCKTVIGHRLKQSGMFWTVKGANSILALRCSHLNGRFEDYWEGRGAA